MATVRVSPLQRAISDACGRWHRSWSLRHEPDTANWFTPRGDDSDYNLHVPDVEASGAAEDQLAEGMNALRSAASLEELDTVTARLGI